MKITFSRVPTRKEIDELRIFLMDRGFEGTWLNGCAMFGSLPVVPPPPPKFREVNEQLQALEKTDV